MCRHQGGIYPASPAQSRVADFLFKKTEKDRYESVTGWKLCDSDLNFNTSLSGITTACNPTSMDATNNHIKNWCCHRGVFVLWVSVFSVLPTCLSMKTFKDYCIILLSSSSSKPFLFPAAIKPNKEQWHPLVVKPESCMLDDRHRQTTYLFINHLIEQIE